MKREKNVLWIFLGFKTIFSSWWSWWWWSLPGDYIQHKTFDFITCSLFNPFPVKERKKNVWVSKQDKKYIKVHSTWHCGSLVYKKRMTKNRLVFSWKMHWPFFQAPIHPTKRPDCILYWIYMGSWRESVTHSVGFLLRWRMNEIQITRSFTIMYSRNEITEEEIRAEMGKKKGKVKRTSEDGIL